MLPLDHERAINRIIGGPLIHFRLTTTLAPGVYFVSDQFADDETAAVSAHVDAFVKHHHDYHGTYELSWVVLPAKADDPMAVGGRPA